VPPIAAPSVIGDTFLQIVTIIVCPVARWLTVAGDARQAEALGSSLSLGRYSAKQQFLPIILACLIHHNEPKLGNISGHVHLNAVPLVRRRAIRPGLRDA
jgi:hypothetical protein